jgi:hypothetical protein
VINLEFDDSSRAGEWVATGTIDGDALTVSYNVIMMMADFMDGVYTRSAQIQ